MRLGRSSHTKVFAVALVALSMALLAGGALQASNMGFKMNKVIQPVGGGFPFGYNWVALPYRHPYQNAQDICNALGLVAPARVELTRAQIGEVAGHTCGDAGPWLFTAVRERMGLEIYAQPTQVSGILVGSHAGGSPGVSIYKGNPPVAPIGVNFYPVLYHGTAANAEEVCNQLGLNDAASIERSDGLGTILGYGCGDAPVTAFPLVLGEAVKITSQPTDRLNVVAPHF